MLDSAVTYYVTRVCWALINGPLATDFIQHDICQSGLGYENNQFEFDISW